MPALALWRRHCCSRDTCYPSVLRRVLLPYVHILVPQAARPDQQHRSGDLHTKFRKLKQFIKQSMHEQAAASAAAAAASAAQKHGQHGSIDAGLAARGGHGSSTDGAAPAPLSAVAAAAAALAAGRASAVGLAPGNSSSGGGADTGDPPPRPHQLRPNSLSGPVGWASLRRHSAGGQNEQSRSQQFEREEQVDLVASVNAGLSPAQADAAAAVVSEPGNMGALTLVADGLQHNLQEVRLCTRLSLSPPWWLLHRVTQSVVVCRISCSARII